MKSYILILDALGSPYEDMIKYKGFKLLRIEPFPFYSKLLSSSLLKCSLSQGSHYIEFEIWMEKYRVIYL